MMNWLVQTRSPVAQNILVLLESMFLNAWAWRGSPKVTAACETKLGVSLACDSLIVRSAED